MAKTLYEVWGLGHFNERSGRAGLLGPTGEGFVCFLVSSSLVRVEIGLPWGFYLRVVGF